MCIRDSSGGDGTLNEVVRAVLEYQGDKPPIGYIPSGSTNDFATSLNIPKDMVRAAQHIAAGEPVQCDIGRANGERSFNYVAAFGAFTEVSYATPQHLKNLLGHQAYVLEGVKSLAALKPYKVKVTSNELQVEDSFVYGMVSNTESVGGMRGLAGTGVDLQDGLFEVTLIKDCLLYTSGRRLSAGSPGTWKNTGTSGCGYDKDDKGTL